MDPLLQDQQGHWGALRTPGRETSAGGGHTCSKVKKAHLPSDLQAGLDDPLYHFNRNDCMATRMLEERLAASHIPQIPRRHSCGLTPVLWAEETAPGLMGGGSSKLRSHRFQGELRAGRCLRKFTKQQISSVFLLSTQRLPLTSREAPGAPSGVLPSLLFLLLREMRPCPSWCPGEAAGSCQGHRHFHQRSKEALRLSEHHTNKLCFSWLR